MALQQGIETLMDSRRQKYSDTPSTLTRAPVSDPPLPDNVGLAGINISERPEPSLSETHAAAQALKSKGRGGDTDVVHVNEAEKKMLKRMGGSGTINPHTGLQEFVSFGGIGDDSAVGGALGSDGSVQGGGGGDNWGSSYDPNETIADVEAQFDAAGLGATVGGSMGQVDPSGRNHFSYNPITKEYHKNVVDSRGNVVRDSYGNPIQSGITVDTGRTKEDGSVVGISGKPAEDPSLDISGDYFDALKDWDMEMIAAEEDDSDKSEAEKEADRAKPSFLSTALTAIPETLLGLVGLDVEFTGEDLIGGTTSQPAGTVQAQLPSAIFGPLAALDTMYSAVDEQGRNLSQMALDNILGLDSEFVSFTGDDVAYSDDDSSFTEDISNAFDNTVDMITGIPHDIRNSLQMAYYDAKLAPLEAVMAVQDFANTAGDVLSGETSLAEALGFDGESTLAGGTQRAALEGSGNEGSMYTALNNAVANATIGDSGGSETYPYDPDYDPYGWRVKRGLLPGQRVTSLYDMYLPDEFKEGIGIG